MYAVYFFKDMLYAHYLLAAKHHSKQYSYVCQTNYLFLWSGSQILIFLSQTLLEELYSNWVILNENDRILVILASVIVYAYLHEYLCVFSTDWSCGYGIGPSTSSVHSSTVYIAILGNFIWITSLAAASSLL